MGDKGGRKDRAKNRQQQVKKHDQSVQRRQEKAPARAATPVKLLDRRS